VIWTDPCSCGLKQQSGDILMHGFGPVAQTLTANGLLDALHLWVHPHFAGVGTTSDMLFSEGNNTRLKLIETRTSTPASSCFLTRWPTPNAPT
jgi:dihydrofolate reductase